MEETSTQNPTEGTTRSQANEYRMIFYALLEAAMRYREGYFREDVDLYTETLMEKFKDDLNNAKSSAEKARIEKLIKGKTLALRQKLEKTNTVLYEAIAELEETLSEKGKVFFDNYSTAYGLIAEELAKAKSTMQILTVCQLYNSGAMDETFEELKKSEYKEEKTPTKIIQL
jgi:hypothetical protein